MLTEIALTPHTFQPCSVDATNWAGQLRTLNQRLAHYGKLCPLIFSNLNGGHESNEWLAVVTKDVGTIKRTSHQRPAMDLFDRIKRDHLVFRPIYGEIRAAEEETQWVQEAMQPALSCPIDKIVTSWQGLNACRKCAPDAVGLNGLDGHSFWQDVTTSPSLAPSIPVQVEALRPIWLHGQLLAVVLPYGLGNEADWFFAFANRALKRPSGFGVPLIELHVSDEGKPAEWKSQGTSHQAIRSAGIDYRFCTAHAR